MAVQVSGIVLAGGRSRRLGRDKAVEPVGGVPLLQRVLGRLAQVTYERVVVVNEAARAAALPLPPDVRAVVDRYPGAGPLGGIFTGLSAAVGGWGLVTACDMPFLNVRLLRHLLSQREGYDAVVPLLDGRPEPTHALYSRACLPHIQERLEAGRYKIAAFFESVRVRFVPQEEVEALDPGRLSFFNVNTQEDLDRAEALARAEADGGAVVRVTVELFGPPRLAAGRPTVEVEIPAVATAQDLARALARSCPALVGVLVEDGGRALRADYVVNINGLRFVSGPMELAPGDRLLVFSSQAGG